MKCNNSQCENGHIRGTKKEKCIDGFHSREFPSLSVKAVSWDEADIITVDTCSSFTYWNSYPLHIDTNKASEFKKSWEKCLEKLHALKLYREC